ncbi:MAG TPA: cytochrome c [Bryobacteraceae bacterium]|jgi:mono/diheme cytochrome c family protein|nr:cytochrome c [Bryobacteraceae bacterium]
MTGRLLIPLAFAAALVAQTTRSVWDGVYTAAQAKRGQDVYAAKCASCHGSDLTGGESAPPLAGPGFLSNWTSLTVGDLFERTRVSMPQDDPGKLPRAQVADVIAYLLSANRFPEGKVELDKQAEVLKQIRIDAEAPKK